jgi:sugar lactone lactonase YvrE
MPPPPLPYVPIPESFTLPPNANFGGTSGIAFNSKGNIFVLHRGLMPLMEFDPDGKFIRGVGDGLFDRPHGLHIDKDDNIWATDVAAKSRFTAELLLCKLDVPSVEIGPSQRIRAL